MVTIDEAIDQLVARHASWGFEPPTGCDPADIDALEHEASHRSPVPLTLPAEYRRFLERIDPRQLRLLAEIELCSLAETVDALSYSNPDLPRLLIPISGEGYSVELELAQPGHDGGAVWVWDPGLDGIHRVAGGLPGLLKALAEAPGELMRPEDNPYVYVTLDLDTLFDAEAGWDRTEWPTHWLAPDGYTPDDLHSRVEQPPSLAQVLASGQEGVTHARVQVHAGTAAGSIVRVFDPDTAPRTMQDDIDAHLASLTDDERERVTARITDLATLINNDWTTMPVDELTALNEELQQLAGLADPPKPTCELVWWPQEVGPVGPARDSVVEITVMPGRPADTSPFDFMVSAGDDIVGTVVTARKVADTPRS